MIEKTLTDEIEDQQQEERNKVFEYVTGRPIKFKASSDELYIEGTARLQAFNQELQDLYKKVKVISKVEDGDNEALSEEHKQELVKLLGSHSPLCKSLFTKYLEIEKELRAKGDWRQVAGDIAWLDTIWIFTSEVLEIVAEKGSKAVTHADFTLGAQVVWPFALAVFVLFKYRNDAIEQIKQEKGHPPTVKEMEKINWDTGILAAKIFSAVAGWEIGALVAQAIGLGSSVLAGPGGVIVAGLLIGLSAALAVGLTNFVGEYVRSQQTGEEFDSKAVALESLRLFASTFVAASSWFFISLIPGGSLGLNIFITLVKSALTYFVVKASFYDLYKVLGGESTKDKQYSKEGEIQGRFFITHTLKRLRYDFHSFFKSSNYNAPHAEEKSSQHSTSSLELNNLDTPEPKRA